MMSSVSCHPFCVRNIACGISQVGLALSSKHTKSIIIFVWYLTASSLDPLNHLVAIGASSDDGDSITVCGTLGPFRRLLNRFSHSEYFLKYRDHVVRKPLMKVPRGPGPLEKYTLKVNKITVNRVHFNEAQACHQSNSPSSSSPAPHHSLNYLKISLKITGGRENDFDNTSGSTDNILGSSPIWRNTLPLKSQSAVNMACRGLELGHYAVQASSCAVYGPTFHPFNTWISHFTRLSTHFSCGRWWYFQLSLSLLCECLIPDTVPRNRPVGFDAERPGNSKRSSPQW